MVERTYDIFTLLLLFLVAYPVLPDVEWFGEAALVSSVLTAGLAVTVAVLAVFGERPIHAVLRPLSRFVAVERLEQAGSNIASGLAGVRRRTSRAKDSPGRSPRGSCSRSRTGC